MPKRLVVYMTTWCASCQDSQAALAEWGVPAHCINIARDKEAAGRLRQWTGFESVPTLLVSEDKSVEPFEAPAPLPPGRGPRGIDRGPMLTEPTRPELRAWLVKHDFVAR